MYYSTVYDTIDAFSTIVHYTSWVGVCSSGAGLVILC